MSDLEKARARSAVLAEHLIEEAKLYQEQGNALLKWSATACMSLNAGALLATINATKIDPTSQVWAGVWFLLGVTASVLLSGVLVSVYNGLASDNIEYAVALKEFDRSGDDSDKKRIEQDDADPAAHLGGIAVAGLVTTLLFFVIGCSILIEGA